MTAIYEYGERKEQKGMEEGIKEGMKEGREKGIEEGIKETILKFYKSGMTPEEISERLETDIRKIKKIINE